MASKKSFSWSEIKKHSKKNDAWVVISGKIYDVTNYLAEHPGGPQWITDWAGKEATEAFKTKGGMGLEHSSFALDILKGYLIGTVDKKEK